MPLAHERVWYRKARLPLLAFVLAGCFEERPSTEGRPDPDAWKLGDTIVALQDDSLGGIGSIGWAVLIDDGFVLADPTRSELVAYSFAGTERWRFGRRGRGPSEFENIAWVQSVADSIVVYDSDLRRFTVLAAVGSLVRTASSPPNPDGWISWPIGFVGDSVVAMMELLPAPHMRAPQVIRDSIAVVLWGQGVVRQLIRGQGAPYFVAPFGRVGEAQVPIPYGRRSAALATHGQVVAILDDSIVLRWKGQRTDTIVVASLLPTPRPVTRSDISAVQEQWTSANADLRRMYRAVEARPFPPLMARFGRESPHGSSPFSLTQDGTLWGQLGGSASQQHTEWLVLRDRGEPFRVLDPRQHVRILDARADTILVQLWVEDDLNRIEVRRLRSPG